MTKQTDFLAQIQTPESFVKRSNAEVLDQIRALVSMHKRGLLGGQLMPEDANPHLAKSAADNFLFFTLPMALNYQRNSYALWPAATKTFQDKETRFVFDPVAVSRLSIEVTRTALLKHKVALQPIKHTETWTRICKTLAEHYDGDIRTLLKRAHFSAKKIKQIIQDEQKSSFPYLSGPKICNYWLYVLEQYTDMKFVDREFLTVAPDTHITQATFKLGLLPPSSKDAPRIQELVANVWKIVLANSEFVPIDIHTPLWLWSRKGFPDIVS